MGVGQKGEGGLTRLVGLGPEGAPAGRVAVLLLVGLDLDDVLVGQARFEGGNDELGRFFSAHPLSVQRSKMRTVSGFGSSRGSMTAPAGKTILTGRPG